MKKITFIFLTVLFCSPVFAQIKPGMELGFQFTNATVSGLALNGNTTKHSGDLKPAGRAGIIVDFLIVNNFSIQPGIVYSLYNIQHTNTISLGTLGEFDNKNRQLIHNLQLPLYFFYKTSVEGRGRFIVGAGPYLGVTLAGSLKNADYIIDTSDVGQYTARQRVSKTNLDIGDKTSTSQYKPLEAGITAAIGYEFPIGAFIKGHYQHGLTNTMPGGNSDNWSKNWNFGISLGIFFGDGGGGYSW